MRLIEAEPLIEYFEESRIECIDLDPNGAFAYGIAKQAVEEAETVEAIPIEWLTAWKKANDFHSRSSSQIVNKVIKDYREEQENACLPTE